MKIMVKGKSFEVNHDKIQKHIVSFDIPKKIKIDFDGIVFEGVVTSIKWDYCNTSNKYNVTAIEAIDIE